jgi:hypothetical protein
MVRRRKKQVEQFVDVLSDLTGTIWQVGAVATFCFIIIAVFAFRWVIGFIEFARVSLLLAPMIETYGRLLYALPIILFSFAFILGLRTIKVFTHERFF